MSHLRIAVLVVLGALISFPAFGLPRFASRTGAKCQSCHVNPSGGGMRQAFGVQYGRETLPVPTWSEELGLDDFSTKLTEFISVGADFRTLYYYIQDPAEDKNAFFEMQGNVNFNFKIAKKVNIYISKELYSGFEIFGLLNILPGNGFIKVGKFIPNYGMKVDEHRVFVRDKTGFSPETGSPFYTGGEIGFLPGPVTITGGIYNSEEVRGPGIASKAFLGRAEGIFKVSTDMNFAIGADVFYKKVSGTKTTLVGGFSSISYKDLSVLGEVDLNKRQSVGDTTGIILYVEADYVVTPGLDLKFIYDFYDRDKDLKTGSASRYSFGFEFFPISGVEVRPLYRILKEEPTDFKNNEFNLVIHFYL